MGTLGDDDARPTSDHSPSEELASALRLLKDRAGLSLGQLATRSVCSTSALARYLNGKIFPPRAMVQTISDVCGGDTEAVLALWELAWTARGGRQRGQAPEAPRTGERLAAAVPPQQLPPDVRGFVGRSADLAWLDFLLAGRGTGDDADPIQIGVIAGTAGVGKTALAVRWAHRVADRFPDGQLWVNLRGYDPQRPVTPGQALHSFLRALGVPGSDLPSDLDTQTALYRTLLAGRRILIVLDNASDAEQVRPLLPGSGSCLVLVTSRDSLSGLVVRDGGTRLRLGLLDIDDAIALLRQLISSVGSEVDSTAIPELAARCAGLPLALRIAADRVSTRGVNSVELVTSELAALSRLDTLSTGQDPYTAMREVFSWSYEALPEAAAMLFRRLGILPVPTWDAHVAAALVQCPVVEARRLLGVLADAHLVDSWEARRYQMHDLLRAYALEYATAEDSDSERRAATGRVLDLYRHVAATAMDIAFPSERDRRPRVDPPAAPAPRLADQGHALGWLDGERSNLLAMTVYAAANGWAAHAHQLAATLYRYLIVGAHHSEASIIHSAAFDAAHSLADPRAEATALHNLGSTYWLLGRQGDAHDHYRRALAIFRKTGDVLGEARALGNLANVYWRWGRMDEAYHQLLRALAIINDNGDLSGKATALIALGEINMDWGHHDEASAQYLEALDLYRQIDDRAGEACSTKLLGDLHYRRGQYADSLAYYRLAFRISRSIGHRTVEALALDGIGAVYERRERYQEAMDHHRRAFAIRHQVGDRAGEARSLSNLGTLHQRQGQYEQAVDHYHKALKIACELGGRSTEAITLNGLGEVAQAQAKPDDARKHHLRALEVATELKDRFEQARALAGLARAEDTLPAVSSTVRASGELA